MIMTINEQIKEILEIHRKSVDWKKEAPTFNDYRANKIISLFQPRTTSTDIEEKELVSLNIKIATKDLVKRVDAVIPEMDLHSKISLRGKIIRLIAEELAPHLSNKSELKKEAVSKTKLTKILRDVGLFQTGQDSDYDEYNIKWSNKKGLALKKKLYMYLSSNEKEVSGKGEE